MSKPVVSPFFAHVFRLRYIQKPAFQCAVIREQKTFGKSRWPFTLARPEAVGHSFNLGNPRSIVTVYHLAREIVRLAGSPSKIVFVPWNKVDVELRIPDIEKARELLGFEPRVDLEEGLLRTIEWYRDRKLP